jgi:mannosylglycoprotein endo-beta-mannosidase
MNSRLFILLLTLTSAISLAQSAQQIEGWQMQDAAKVSESGAIVSTAKFRPDNWYAAVVPGTVLTTLVKDGVYPEPLYGENMRAIPESLNKTNYWYRTTVNVPKSQKARHTWLHFAGINYAAEVWVNGRSIHSRRL